MENVNSTMRQCIAPMVPAPIDPEKLKAMLAQAWVEVRQIERRSGTADRMPMDQQQHFLSVGALR